MEYYPTFFINEVSFVNKLYRQVVSEEKKAMLFFDLT